MALESLNEGSRERELRVLLVEDSPDDAELVLLELRRRQFRVTAFQASSRQEMAAVLATEPIDLALTDHAMPGLSSLDVIELTRGHCPCIVVSGAVGEETAVTLLQQGAVDYINKANLNRLAPAVKRALEESHNRQARERAEEELRRAHAELERRVEARTAALQQSYRRLRQEMDERRRAEYELREARLKLTRLREDERLHLSREIHDGVVQDLLGIGFALADTERAVLGGMDAAESYRRIHGYRDELLEAVRRLRNLIKGLRPPGLEEFGLLSALEEFSRSLVGSHPEARISVEVAPEGAQVPPVVAQSFFRIAQEAVRNALRHASADRIHIGVTLDEAEARLTVSDNGLGFKAPERLGELARDDHFGLVLMDEHAQLAGGAFELETAPGKGTTVSVAVPLARAPVER